MLQTILNTIFFFRNNLKDKHQCQNLWVMVYVLSSRKSIIIVLLNPLLKNVFFFFFWGESNIHNQTSLEYTSKWESITSLRHREVLHFPSVLFLLEVYHVIEQTPLLFPVSFPLWQSVSKVTGHQRKKRNA